MCNSSISQVQSGVMLPTYESNATLEQRQQKLEFMAEQMRLIHNQEKDGIPITRVKIRCGCHKLVVWWGMYRCLYCSLFYCKDCAEIHFGAKVPPPLGA